MVLRIYMCVLYMFVYLYIYITMWYIKYNCTTKSIITYQTWGWWSYVVTDYPSKCLSSCVWCFLKAFVKQNMTLWKMGFKANKWSILDGWKGWENVEEGVSHVLAGYLSPSPTHVLMQKQWHLFLWITGVWIWETWWAALVSAGWGPGPGSHPFPTLMQPLWGCSHLKPVDHAHCGVTYQISNYNS